MTERFVRKFLPLPAHTHDTNGDLFPDWRELQQQGAYGTLWRRDSLSPPIHVRGQPPVTEAVVKAVKDTADAETELDSYSSAIGTPRGRGRRRHTDSHMLEGTGTGESSGSASAIALRSEINTLAALAELQHENIVLTYGIELGATPDAPDTESFMLLLELCTYDLGNLIYDKWHAAAETMGCQSWTEVCLTVSQQMAAGLTFIQSEEVGELFP